MVKLEKTGFEEPADSADTGSESAASKEEPKKEEASQKEEASEKQEADQKEDAPKEQEKAKEDTKRKAALAWKGSLAQLKRSGSLAIPEVDKPEDFLQQLKSGEVTMSTVSIKNT